MKIAIFTNPEKENNELKDSITRVAAFVGFEIDEENPDVETVTLNGDICRHTC